MLRKKKQHKVRKSACISYGGVIRGGPNDNKPSISIDGAADYRDDLNVLYLSEDTTTFHEGEDRNQVFAKFLERTVPVMRLEAHAARCAEELAKFREMIGDEPGLLITDAGSVQRLIFIWDLTKDELYAAMKGVKISAF